MGANALYWNNGNDNVAIGGNALNQNMSGSDNNAVGALALYNNTTGTDNNAVGFNSLNKNTSGGLNVAMGSNALTANIDGDGNTGLGYSALFNNTHGGYNTAVGFNSLAGNTTGSFNVALGQTSAFSNTTGTGNIAMGMAALFNTTTGNYNSALGFNALYENVSGVQNTAIGTKALYDDKGNYNTAAGYGALLSNTTGNYNVALGWKAGYALTTGSNNIDIDNQGDAGEANTIRIGTEGTQTKAYIAGIHNNNSVSGLAVVVDANGQLGVANTSSERFKTAIEPMDSGSAKLAHLRPVTFHYKSDPNGPLHYGLIAEEVAKVYPDLVVRDPAGQIEGVRYDELSPLLLKEVQQLDQANAALTAEVRALKDGQAQLRAAAARDNEQRSAEFRALKAKLNSAIDKMNAATPLVAER